MLRAQREGPPRAREEGMLDAGRIRFVLGKLQAFYEYIRGNHDRSRFSFCLKEDMIAVLYQQCLCQVYTTWQQYSGRPVLRNVNLASRLEVLYFACRHQLVPYVAVSYVSRPKFKHFQRFLFLIYFVMYRETTSHVEGCTGQPQPKSTILSIPYDHLAMWGYYLEFHNQQRCAGRCRPG